MLLALATWPEVEAYLQRSQGILVPLGSTEQHGPIGLIGTDAICAEAIAQGAGERADALVGPTLSLGANHFNLAFPGTISLRATTLMALVSD
jgi:creatinine amidohydrolase